MRVRECPHSAGGFSPVVSLAVHVSVGNEIQRETIRREGNDVTGHATSLTGTLYPLTVSLSLLTMNVLPVARLLLCLF